MSHEEISSPLSAAIIKMIWTESHDTTVEYVSDAGASVICPPPTNLAFCQKFSLSLISNMM